MTPDRVMLTTERVGLVLRELTIDEIAEYYEVVDRNRAHLHQHGDYRFEHDATVEDVRRYFENPWDNNVRLGIWSDGRLIGRIDLHPIDPPKWVLGYWLDRASTGRGFVTLACRAAISHLKQLGATELYAGVTNGNDASIGVLRRLGFDHIQDVEQRTRWRLPLIDKPPPAVMA